MSALLTTYSAANRVVETQLAIRYSQTRIKGQWEYESGTTKTTFYEAWAYTRTASKAYKYVGMTLAAAQSCADAMIEKYQRSTKYSFWPGGNLSEFSEADGGSIPMADVAVQLVAGGMYEVVVNVNETDSRMRIGNASFSTLFATENKRDYDA